MTGDNLDRAVDMMLRTDRMHKALIDSRVGNIGIHRTQHRILMHLARHGALHSQKALAEHLDISPAAVTGALKKIEQDGYIVRKLGHDNRFFEIEITEKGRVIVNKTKKLFSEAARSMFDGFSDDELNVYIRCLDKIQNNIKTSVLSPTAIKSDERKNDNI